MHARQRLGRMLAVLLLLAAIAACGSSKNDESTKSTGDQGTTTTEQSSGSGSSDSGSGDFGSLAERGSKATVRITYKNADGTEFTLSQDPPKQAMLSKDGKYISDGDHIVVCTGTGSGAQCFEMSQQAGQDQMGSFLAAFSAPFQLIKSLADNALTSKGIDTSSETIAGRKAECASIDASKVAGSSGTGTEEICIDKDTGVLLRVTSDDKVQLEATDIGKPESDDFEPTTTPQTVPSVPGK